MNRQLAFCVVTFAVCFSMEPAIGQQAVIDPQKADASDGPTLQEIIVTAQRRAAEPARRSGEFDCVHR